MLEPHKHRLAAILRNLTDDPYNRLYLSIMYFCKVKLTFIIVQVVEWKNPSKIISLQARCEIAVGLSVLIEMIIK